MTARCEHCGAPAKPEAPAAPLFWIAVEAADHEKSPLAHGGFVICTDETRDIWAAELRRRRRPVLWRRASLRVVREEKKESSP